MSAVVFFKLPQTSWEYKQSIKCTGEGRRGKKRAVFLTLSRFAVVSMETDEAKPFFHIA